MFQRKKALMATTMLALVAGCNQGLSGPQAKPEPSASAATVASAAPTQSAQTPSTVAPVGEKPTPKTDLATFLTNWCKVSTTGSSLEKGYVRQYVVFKDGDGVVHVAELCGAKGVEEVAFKAVKCGDFTDLFVEVDGRLKDKKGFYRAPDPFNSANQNNGRLQYVGATDMLPVSEAKLTLAYWSTSGSRKDVPSTAKYVVAQLVDTATCGDGSYMAVSYTKPTGGGGGYTKKVAETAAPAYVTQAQYDKDKEAQGKKDKEQDDAIAVRVTVSELAQFQKICGGKSAEDCNFALFHSPRMKAN